MNDSRDVYATIMAVMCGLFIVFVVGALWGSSQEKAYWQKEAVKRNHAEWSVSVDGKTTFKWKGGNP